jgi:hypothetical protein
MALGHFVMVIDLTERLQHVSTGIWKVGRDFDKPSAGTGQD